MKKITLVPIAAVVSAAVLLVLWPREETQAPKTARAAIGTVVLPTVFSEQAQLGERAFNGVCAACHGDNAAGTESGPPLVHRIYEPSHHADYAFEMAVSSGVRAHHWKFGDMPPQPGLTPADVAAIIAYVRELQRANGIY